MATQNHLTVNMFRTATDVMANIQEKVKIQKPREVYTTLTLNGSISAPRDLKQVKNTKYLQNKVSRPNQKSANNADDLQHLMSQLDEHPYMQEVVQSKGKPPCIIVYCTAEQMQDMKNFCSTDSVHSSVICVDRTFNLGAVYVTIMVFHNKNLIMKTSNAAPIMVGPAYLHWDGYYQTYHRFFQSYSKPYARHEGN